MNQRVFISYRRDDCLSEARQICDTLGQQSEVEDVFMDTRSIQAGRQWPDEVQAALASAQTVFVVVKDWDKWLGVKRYGQRRIDDPDDWIQKEVALALQSNRTVIPVLVGEDRAMVQENVLPPAIKGFAKKQRIILRPDEWDHDIQQLMEALSIPRRCRRAPTAIDAPEPPSPPLRRRVAIATTAGLIAIISIWWIANALAPTPPEPVQKDDQSGPWKELVGIDSKILPFQKVLIQVENKAQESRNEFDRMPPQNPYRAFQWTAPLDRLPATISLKPEWQGRAQIGWCSSYEGDDCKVVHASKTRIDISHASLDRFVLVIFPYDADVERKLVDEDPRHLVEY